MKIAHVFTAVCVAIILMAYLSLSPAQGQQNPDPLPTCAEPADCANTDCLFTFTMNDGKDRFYQDTATTPYIACRDSTYPGDVGKTCTADPNGPKQVCGIRKFYHRVAGSTEYGCLLKFYHSSIAMEKTAIETESSDCGVD